MRVLLLSRYGPLGASSRVRSYQYLPYLRAHGMEVAVQPLLEDVYLRRLYGGRKTRWKRILKAYSRRVGALLGSRSYDLLWIEKELLPMCPALLESLIRTFRIPYMVDYDDAVFHRYDRHPNPVVRRLLGQKVDAVMRAATLVVAGNGYIATRARRAGARRVEVLPSVIDLDRYPAEPIPRGVDAPFTVGWIGTPITRPFLALLEEPLRRIAERGEVRLQAVGAGEARMEGVTVETPTWSEGTEVELLSRCDVGVMPLPDGPFERGKCGYKLIQFMGCHLPVVASPVGVNQDIVDEGVSGFLAGSPDDWARSLTSLRDSPDLRRRMGRVGRRRVEAEYSLQRAAPRLHALLTCARL